MNDELELDYTAMERRARPNPDALNSMLNRHYIRGLEKAKEITNQIYSVDTIKERLEQEIAEARGQVRFE